MPRRPQDLRSRRPAHLLLAAAGLSLLVLSGCPRPDIVPLIGEDPEVIQLIGQAPPDDPSVSPLAAARRLHQALIQKDTELAWALLAVSTREALDQRGAAIGVSGRELLDASTLPGAGGTIRKVRFDLIFFGPDVVDLAGEEPGPSGGDEAVLRAISREGQITERTFVREEDGWKLALTEF